MDRRMMGLAAGWLILTTAAASAYEINDIDVEWWTGTGTAHRVLLVVDFWPYNGEADSFAFGYQFDQSQITGLNLLYALQAANQGFSFAHDGGFITDIWYTKDSVTYHAGYQWPQSYWSYWVSSDHAESWEYSMWGAANRILQDGDSDGWLAKPGDDWVSQPVTPLRPQTLPGDLNCDGLVDFNDISPFVLALSDPPGYYAWFPTCNRMNGDINHDRHVDFADIDPFVTLLMGG